MVMHKHSRPLAICGLQAMLPQRQCLPSTTAGEACLVTGARAFEAGAV